MKKLASLLLLLPGLVLASPAAAATFVNEVEPNDTIATAQAVSLDAVISGSRVGDASADYYAFTVAAGTRLDFVVNFTTPTASAQVDPILALYDSNGDLLSADDDGFQSFLPGLFQFEFLTAGTYYVAIGDVGDEGNPFTGGNGLLVGGGADTYSYQLSISVPEPSSLAGLLVFGLGGATLARRRNRA